MNSLLDKNVGDEGKSDGAIKMWSTQYNKFYMYFLLDENVGGESEGDGAIKM